MDRWKHNFRDLVHKENVTVKEIASKTGISERVLYAMNRDAYYNLTKDNIGKLCDFFGVEPGDLIVSENGKNSPSLQTSSAKATLLFEDKGDYSLHALGLSPEHLSKGISSLSSENVIIF